MEKITGAERERLTKLGREYLNEWRQEREAALKKLPEPLSEFMQDCRRTSSSPAQSDLAKDLRSGLADGRYKKPSDFFSNTSLSNRNLE